MSVDVAKFFAMETVRSSPSNRLLQVPACSVRFDRIAGDSNNSIIPVPCDAIRPIFRVCPCLQVPHGQLDRQQREPAWRSLEHGLGSCPALRDARGPSRPRQAEAAQMGFYCSRRPRTRDGSLMPTMVRQLLPHHPA